MGLSVLSYVREQNTWLGLSLSSVSKHNMWLYYGWVCRCCRPSENTIHGWGCRLSVNTTCGCIMDGFVGVVIRQRTEYMVVLWLGLSLSSVSKHNMWLYYGWVCRCCHPSENTIHGCGCRCRLSVNITCGCIMDGFVGVVVLQKTEYMVGVVVVVCQ